MRDLDLKDIRIRARMYKSGLITEQELINAVESLLQQTPCSKLRELLVQMHGNLMQQTATVKNWNEDEDVRQNMEAVRRVIWLIDAQKPVA